MLCNYGPCIVVYLNLVLFLRKYNKISCSCYSGADDHDRSGATETGERDDLGDIDATG